jgi:hypothetical protein
MRLLPIGGDKDVSFMRDADGKIQGAVIKNAPSNGSGTGEREAE